MTKKEVLEIRKQFSPQHCNITKIAGCYVNYEKEKLCQFKQSFLSLSEEEAFKYFDIFKKSLSKAVGKNLQNLSFPLIQEETGGTQNFLLRLRNSKLEADDLIEEMYDNIITHYAFEENYYIILIHGIYDIPGKATDGVFMEDSSDDVYEYIMACICPVALSKAGLCYYGDKNIISNRIRDWVIGAPDKAFLFPAFTDRNTDIHNMLYYTNNPLDLQAELIDNLFGTEIPADIEEQKQVFHEVLSSSQVNHLDTALDINDTIIEMIQEQETQNEAEPLVLDKHTMDHILQKNDIRPMETEHENIDGILATNVINTKTITLQAEDIVAKVSANRSDLISTKIMDGKKCLVIEIQGKLEVNGLDVEIH
ncbi:MAG: DUF4317 domain-containing protein [Lachnospiraceae bacterium]|nr:DUF4317 domain-containing protein [Lachnospiraceae bacterium]